MNVARILAVTPLTVLAAYYLALAAYCWHFFDRVRFIEQIVLVDQCRSSLFRFCALVPAIFLVWAFLS